MLASQWNFLQNFKFTRFEQLNLKQNFRLGKFEKLGYKMDLQVQFFANQKPIIFNSFKIQNMVGPLI